MGIFKKKKKAEVKKPAAKKPVAKKVETKKPTAKKTTSGTAKKPVAKKPEPTNIYYLSARFDGKNRDGWEIKRGNASKVTAVTRTKEEAKEKVKQLAKNSEATVIIYKLDGKIEETYKISKK